MIAVLISFVGIVAYIAVRFELRFGVAAALATFHDVLAVLGVFYILDKEITLLVVTALLTLAGYSLTDTVVVFDRIRENLRSRRREDEETIINGAINQVLSRTIVTSLTVVIVLIPLVLAGARSCMISRWRCWGASCSAPTPRSSWQVPCCCYGPAAPGTS